MKTNAENQKARDDRQRAMGYVQRKVWADPAEHEHLKECLAKYRRKQERLDKRNNK